MLAGLKSYTSRGGYFSLGIGTKTAVNGKAQECSANAFLQTDNGGCAQVFGQLQAFVLIGWDAENTAVG